MKLLDDKIFYPLAAVIAIALIAFAMSWPQGLGTRSPPPFGHAEELPDYYRMVKERDARLKREAVEKEERRAQQASEASVASSVISEVADSAGVE
ncbi:hypothetical protein ABAC460_09930 [Asticcacaulis sp. AC460]|uniref:hypothetical protein n=1 Tax=Asticcacaulis sp. AC460 TaxID=1282360 RepID=UPI0003C3FFF8|nr:hypothetical protein [Asticcacaulis sp. AC460]ESQ90077.1 hypothetical protein ABAC460_09930 [Asticcacaulis sp. AC460]